MVQKNTTLEECGSTQEVAKALGDAGEPHGTWISSRTQSQGRGRLGRSWVSEPGNLFLSILCREVPASHWSWIPLSVAVAVSRVLEQKKTLAQIKWPNDLIWAKDSSPKKIAGILCEGAQSAATSYVVAGLGINLVGAPQGLDRATASLSQIDPIWNASDAVLEELREDVMDSILREWQPLSRQDTHAIRDQYERLAWLKPGDTVQWTDPRPNQKRLRGKVTGLGMHAELRVSLFPDGQPVSLYSEEVQKMERLP